MIDAKLFRSQLDEVAEQLKRRGFQLDVARIKELEEQRKQVQTETQNLQNERNVLSKNIGETKAKGGDVSEVMAAVNAVVEKLKISENKLTELQSELENIYMRTPNIPHVDVPAGTREDDNVEIRKWGEPTSFSFTAKDHVDLGESLGLLDFDLASKITGSRFVVMQGAIAKLHRALIQFMLDMHTQEHDYCELNVPYIVNSDSLTGTGNLPKFGEDLFALKGEQEFYLIPTAEVPVTNISRDRILENEDLPIRYVAHTPCFRSEAGSYGKDTRGMIRQHQFEKVELVQFVHPENSYAALEELTGHAEMVLQRLQLPYRVMALCAGDMGASAAKTYDLEVWLPGQQKYREISSCSNFEAYQARRMQARFRQPNEKKPQLIHTLNGSGLAIGRTLVAVMENYQNEDGSIQIPEALQNYMGGQKLISKS